MDPVTEQPYKPLLLDPHWWRVNFHRATARYCNNPAVIAANISERSNAGIDKRDVALHVLQELIYQSNNMLEPIVKWPYAPSMRFLPKAPPSSEDFVVQYASCKGYIDHGTSPRQLDSVTRAQEQTRIDQWPPVPRERLDDLHHHWHWDDVLARRTLPNLASASTAPPSAFQGGGLFGSKLGFGQGNVHARQRLETDPRRKTHSDAPPPLSSLGSSRSPRTSTLP